MPEPLHPIQIASARSGLSPHVIRAWERRYGAIKPQRGQSRHRLYSDTEIERLGLMRTVTQAGHPIRTIARLGTSQLQRLVKKSQTTKVVASGRTLKKGHVYRDGALKAVMHFERSELDDVFHHGLMALGHQGFLQAVIAPLAEQIGQKWRGGTLTAAHEHFFIAASKAFLGGLSKQLAPDPATPTLVTCTPAGQLHELGAFMVGVAATHLGWRVAYLGASLPAAEIAGAATQAKATAVALSIIYPDDDPNLRTELQRLRRFLGARTPIIVGGRAASAYRTALDRAGAVIVSSLDECCDALDRIRRERLRDDPTR